MNPAPRFSARLSTTVRVGLLAALVSLALGGASARATVVPVVSGESYADAVFAQPVPGGGPDDGIHRHLLSLINDTPPGQEIRAAIHSISSYSIADALVKRAQAGVDVKVVYPEHKRYDRLGQKIPAAARLEALGSNRIHWCDHGGGGAYGFGCISTHSGGTMHSKFFLFSATGPGGLRKWVTWFGSANLTPDTGTETWNDGLTVYENQALYNAFENELFDPMFGDNQFLSNNDFYRPEIGQGYFSVPSAGLKAHASPEQDGDLVVSQLNGMRADPASGCTVMVGMAIFTRTAVAEKLAAMKHAGCSVFVLVGMDTPSAPGAVKTNDSGACDGDPHLGDGAVMGILKDAQIPIRKKEIHDKLMLLNTTNKGSTVLTGSHNLTKSALRENDEILVELQSPSVYSAFSEHWWSAWSNSCPVGDNL